MILSAQELLSDDQAVTATAISTNVIDLGVRGTPYRAKAALNGDKGKGNPIPFLVQITEAFTHATTSAMTVTLETSAASALTSSTVLATEVIAFADLVAGKQMFLQALPNGVTGRYLGVRYTSASGNWTGGKVTAGVSMGNQTNTTGA